MRIEETTDLAVIAQLESEIPEFERLYSLEKITSRLSGRVFLALLARDAEGTIAGYKLGYAETPTRFYSWIGGVKPACRRQGLARELLRYQEDWCRCRGFEQIQVWSENRYRGMLIFLLTEGYDIHALTGDGAIMFRKDLAKDP
jgi:GNAT superfamily N-acetyltransferase